MKTPSEEQWKTIIKDFWLRWNFPNCCVAIDGRHVRIQYTANSGSEYYNFKRNFSINLMAACDANYCFTVIDVGGFGRNSDGGILQQREFGQRISNDRLGMPRLSYLPGLAEQLPTVFVADEAFPLRSNIMRPYPGKGLDFQKKVFNYRLSHARRIIENTYGILVTRWRCQRVRMCLKPETADHTILACCCLYNFFYKNRKALCHNNIDNTTNQHLLIVRITTMTYFPVGGEMKCLQNWILLEHC